jgi:hypothetical protein
LSTTGKDSRGTCQASFVLTAISLLGRGFHFRLYVFAFMGLFKGQDFFADGYEVGAEVELVAEQVRGT